MPRLRITAVLSVLALLVGIGGTAWLSTRTAGWVVTARPLPASQLRPVTHRHPPPASHHRPAPLRPSRAPAVAASSPPIVTASTAAPPLLPLTMPGLEGGPSYARLRGHLAGRVLLHLRIDGDGRVIDATLAQSSGDAVLDAYALDVVRRWRFAVPDDRPDGISGDLPMHFEPDGPAAADDR